jgi:hypothetical protein
MSTKSKRESTIPLYAISVTCAEEILLIFYSFGEAVGASEFGNSTKCCVNTTS